MPAALAIAYVPRWTEVNRDPAPIAWLAQLAQNARKRTYRLAFYASFGGVSMHFVVIGFSTAFFVVDRGLDLRLVAAMLIAGRALSAPVKIVGGALYDKRGGPWTARLMMASTAALGLPMLLLPADASASGSWFRSSGMAVSVLPVANAMLVAALPPQSGWGIGTFRAALLGSAALLSAIVSGLLGLGCAPARTDADRAGPARPGGRRHAPGRRATQRPRRESRLGGGDRAGAELVGVEAFAQGVEQQAHRQQAHEGLHRGPPR